jgi:hypothetical protein
MGRICLRRAGVVVVSLVLVLLGAGCWNPFAPPGGGDPPPVEVQYKLRTSPENVIYNLNTSYTWRNADEYLACLADSVVFHLNPADVNNPQDPLPPYWGKDEEETIHRNMFAQGSDVQSISLTLTTSLIDYLPDLNRWQYRDAVDLRVLVTDVPENTTYVATAPSEFLFQIDPNEVGPEGQPLWEIIHWWDMSATAAARSAAPGSDETSVSFGRLKAMYRE